MSAPSPALTTASASERLDVMSSAIDSSIVPSLMSRWTCTGFVWPMRCARSVAWSSTAGFHQRSKWMTWSARVRLRPVPAALSDSTNTGSSPFWKRADHRLTGADVRATVQELVADVLLVQVPGEQVAHLGVLREQQDAAALGDDLLHQLVEEAELARTAAETFVRRAEELRRVVADLLELREELDHEAATQHAARRLDLGQGLADDRLVETDLFTGEVDAVVGLGLRWQLRRDAGVALAAAQHERADQQGEVAGPTGVAP